MKMHGWGRFPVLNCETRTVRDEATLSQLVQATPLIARGAGRSYGDSALNQAMTVSMSRFNHMLDFDPETGYLTVEAGVMLADVVECFVPRGWFPSVTPGTKFVTVGGMIAADVHGKNHHGAGAFGNHVEWIDLMTACGEVVRCSRSHEPELFFATIGGMGLTGVIVRACFKLIPIESAWIRKNTVIARDLDEVMDGFEAAADWTYSVAWIDCLASGAQLGRSLIYLGEHAKLDELDAAKRADPLRIPKSRAIRVPIDAPSWILNALTMRSFNSFYYWYGKRGVGEHLVDWNSYFYPLDSVLEWNRVYGRRGMVEYQCVIPKAASREGIAAILRETSAAGQGSFLAVLKLFGAQDSVFSFPMEGYTLALDFPATPKVLRLLDRLDRITVEHGGRIYLVKDSRISRDTFEATESRAEYFRRFRQDHGMTDHFSSGQSQRLAL